MAISPTYAFTIQHPRFMPQAQVVPQTANVVTARAGDANLEVMHFTGTDAINDGFTLKIDVRVRDEMIGRLYASSIDEFLRFLVKEQPSVLFSLKAPNDLADTVFSAYYEGVINDAEVVGFVPSGIGNNDGYSQVTLSLVSRFQAMDRSPHSYVYENTEATANISDPASGRVIATEFVNSPLGTKGITLQQTLARVLTAQQMTEGVDYFFQFNPQMVIDDNVQPNTDFVSSSSGFSLAANYLLHSMDVDATSGLFRYTSRTKVRFQYQESDFDFVNRLCQSEGISILYEVAQVDVTSETLAADPNNSARSIITTSYTLAFLDGTTSTVQATRSVPLATDEDPQFLYPNGTRIFRNILAITDYDNRPIVSLHNTIIDQNTGQITIEYPLIRRAPPVDNAITDVRDVFDVSVANDPLPSAVVVANYSEQTDSVGSTIEHMPINATVWNTRTSATTQGSRISTTDPVGNGITVGTGVRYYYGETVQSSADANRLSVRRMQMLKAQAHAKFASSLAVDIRAGAAMHILDQYYGTSNSVSTDGYVFSVSVRGFNSDVYSQATGLTSPIDEEYVNEFQYIDTNSIHRLVYRPPLTIARPAIKNALQAVVATARTIEGIPYADIDAYGRYLVHFVFDRLGRDARSYTVQAAGARVRKASFFADGLDRSGFHFPLDRDTRVLVAFHAQNPDMPIIMGALPDEYAQSRLRTMSLSEQMSYLRTASGGVMFIDRENNQRIVVETDSTESLSSAINLDNANFSGQNYIELGLQHLDETNPSDLNFGIRMGTNGFHQLAVAKGMQSTIITAPQYRNIVNRRNQEQVDAILAAVEPTSDVTVNVDLNLEDLSDEAFEAELFSFRRYDVDVADFTDNLMPAFALYRNEQYVESTRLDEQAQAIANQAASDEQQATGTDSTTKTPTNSDDVTAPRRAERDAPGSFQRVIGDQYIYRQGHDFEYSYTGDERAINGNINYHFGNHIVDYYPSSTSTWQPEQDLRAQDESALAATGAPFSYDNYMSDADRTRPGIAVRRYLGNYLLAVDGSYVTQTMRNQYTRAGEASYICGNAFTAEIVESIVIDNGNNNTLGAGGGTLEFRVTPMGNVKALAVFSFSGGASSGLTANTFKTESFAHFMVGLGFDVLFCRMYQRLSGAHAEMNLLGDYRFWTLGVRTDVRLIEKRAAARTDELAMVNIRTLGAEMLSGLILCGTGVAASAKNTVKSVKNAVRSSSAVSTIEGGQRIKN